MVAVGMVGVLILVAPHASRGLSRVEPSVLSWLVYGGGVAGIVFGFLWMRRDHRVEWRGPSIILALTTLLTQVARDPARTIEPRPQKEGRGSISA